MQKATGELCMDEVLTWSEQRLELERRLLDAAQALLAHQGTAFALVPFPGRLPARCVAVGELAQIRELIKPMSLEA
jgi:hypothetical protein